MSSHSSHTTTDHAEIRRWAESRGARPACVKGTGGANDPGMIRLDFPGYSGAESLQEISWDDWFKSFDENQLALVYQERTAEGERSNFNKLIARDPSDSTSRDNTGRSRSGSSSGREQANANRGTSQRQHASAGDDASLADREYRDAEGNVHHHTHVYMREHGKDAT